MKYHTSTRKTNTYWQISFIIILYACCIFQIWNFKHDGQGLWINTLLPALNITHFGFKLATSILLLINALLATLFLRRFSLIEIRNHYPTILYLLFSFTFSHTLNFWGVVTASFFILLMLPLLVDLKEDNILSNSFIYGLCCGVLSLLYIPFILLLPLVYVIAINKRLYAFRVFILPIIGMCIAYIYLFTVFYLFDNLDIVLHFSTTLKLQADSINFFMDIGKMPVFLIISVVIGCVSFFNILQKAGNVVVNKRKKQQILLFVLFTQAVIALFFNPPYGLFGQIMIVLFAIALSLSTLYTNKKTVFKIIFFILFIMAFYVNFVIGMLL